LLAHFGGRVWKVDFYDGDVKGSIETPAILIAVDRITESEESNSQTEWFCECALLCIGQRENAASYIELCNGSLEIQNFLKEAEFVGAVREAEDIESDWADLPSAMVNGYLAREVRFNQVVNLVPDSFGLEPFKIAHGTKATGGEHTPRASDEIRLDQE
jgi:hypothetical protein